MDIVFGFVAGLLTLINPCVLPVIPVAVASATSANRLAPLAMAAGMSVAFTVLGVATASFGPAIGLTADAAARAGALAMILFGAVLLAPGLGERFAVATAGIANAAATRMARGGDSGIAALFAGGALLGAVWSPCIGPTLGGAIALASQGGSLAWSAAVMLAFSAGVSVVFLALAYGTREAVRNRRDGLITMARWSKPAMGVVFVLLGAAMFAGLHHVAEAALLEAMPAWLQDLSVSL